MNTTNNTSVPDSVDLSFIVEVRQLSSSWDQASNTVADISPDQHHGITLYQQTQDDKEANSTVVRVKGAKLVVPAALLSLDSTKQSPNGIAIMKRILETVERLGYDSCLANKQKKDHSLQA